MPGRLPTLSWCSSSFASLWRCAQPMEGLLGVSSFGRRPVLQKWETNGYVMVCYTLLNRKNYPIWWGLVVYHNGFTICLPCQYGEDDVQFIVICHIFLWKLPHLQTKNRFLCSLGTVTAWELQRVMWRRTAGVVRWEDAKRHQALIFLQRWTYTNITNRHQAAKQSLLVLSVLTVN